MTTILHTAGATILVLLAIAAIALTGALAGSGLKTDKESVVVPPRDAANATARCPKGTRAVSGGYFGTLGDPREGEAQVVTYASLRAGKRGWRSAAAELLGHRGSLTSFSYCRPERIQGRTASTIVPAGAFGEPGVGRVTAKCPAGTRVISGGFANSDVEIAPAETTVFAHTSRKTGPRRWTVAGSNLGDMPGTLVAQANCREGKKLRTRRVSATLGESGGFETRALWPRCRRPERVVSGGFKSGPITSDGPRVVAHGSRRGGKRAWKVSAAGADGGELIAHAYCERR